MKQIFEFWLKLEFRNTALYHNETIRAKTLTALFDRTAKILTKHNLPLNTIIYASIKYFNYNYSSFTSFKFCGKYYSEKNDCMCEDKNIIIKRIKQNRSYKHDHFKHVSTMIKRIRKDEVFEIKQIYDNINDLTKHFRDRKLRIIKDAYIIVFKYRKSLTEYELELNRLANK